MEPYVARALINRLLSDSERLDLAAYEASLQTQPRMQGRYLTGSELCQRYHLQPHPVDEADTNLMDRLLWIWREKQDALYAEGEAKNGTEPFNIHGDDLLANLRDWEKFAEENYEPPSRYDALSAGLSVVWSLWWAARISIA